MESRHKITGNIRELRAREEMRMTPDATRPGKSNRELLRI